MSKLTRAWIDAQIERELERGNHPDAVRDLAALWTVKHYMCDAPAPMNAESPAKPVVGEVHQESRRHISMDKDTAMLWVDNMVDSDGVHGGKYSWHQAQQYAMNMGYTGQQRLLEFYWAMNAMYADFHKVGKKFGVDKPEFYAHLAKCFIEDPDAKDNKVEEYVKHIVKRN